MRQIVAHFVRQIDAFHHACTAHLRVAQSQNIHGTAYPTKLVLFTIRHQRIFAGILWLQVWHCVREEFVGKGSHGAPGRIRTSDLLVRSQALYPAELRAHIARMQLSKNNR